MATYAIGDIQGCYWPFKKLLKKIKFKSNKDTLWICGDLVNRGPDSLKTLQYIRSLGDSVRCVLGNHDLHLLAIYYTSAEQKKNDTLSELLNSPDVDGLMTWLRQQPLFYFDARLNCAMVHAGIYPGWSVTDCLHYAKEVHEVLTGDHYLTYFNSMYANTPDTWQPGLKKMERWRFITNVFTRMRFIDDDNRMQMKLKGSPLKQSDPSIHPWFERTKKQLKHNRIVFGHWSTLESMQYDNYFALDSACLWGGALTALKISSKIPKWTRLNCDE